MDNWYLARFSNMILLILIPFFLFLVLRFYRWKNRKMELFADEELRDYFFGKRKKKDFVFFIVLYFFAFLFLILSMMDVVSGSIKIHQRRANVIFLVDVSNSMNAQDVEPSRLEKTKMILNKTFDKMSSDRVGLVVFAGNAVSVMPLTTDYSAAQNFISGIETSIISHQGTDFSKAMEIVAEKYQSVDKNLRNVVLISDGEDNEGHEDEAITIAKDNDLRVFSVGVGTEEGGPIPEYLNGQLLGYKEDSFGETVVSRRENKALKKIADKTNRKYIDGNDDSKAVQEILDGLRDYAQQNVDVESKLGEHEYQYFLIISIVLFFIIYLTNPKRDFNI